jgi:hypothetical protein
MTLELKAANNNVTKPTRVLLPLEFMQKNQIGTGDLIKVKDRDWVSYFFFSFDLVFSIAY